MKTLHPFASLRETKNPRDTWRQEIAPQGYTRLILLISCFFSLHGAHESARMFLKYCMDWGRYIKGICLYL